jgi:hypothetical protein
MLVYEQTHSYSYPAAGDVSLRRESARRFKWYPRNTPGYRLHRSLTNLKRIETAGLNDADQEQIEAARNSSRT